MADEQIKISNVPTPVTLFPPPAMDFRRDEDFVARYANNVQFEGTIWDMKLIFGLLDQRGILKGDLKPVVEQHTSISLSWPEIKLLIFLLQLHLAGYEMENGKVKLHPSVIPPEPPTALPPPFDTPKNRESMELIRKMRAEFIAHLSEP
jgi:hypothetical protein